MLDTFKNNTGTTKTGFTVTLYGSGTLDDLAASYAGGAFKFEYKIPSTNALTLLHGKMEEKLSLSLEIEMLMEMVEHKAQILNSH